MPLPRLSPSLGVPAAGPRRRPADSPGGFALGFGRFRVGRGFWTGWRAGDGRRLGGRMGAGEQKNHQLPRCPAPKPSQIHRPATKRVWAAPCCIAHGPSCWSCPSPLRGPALLPAAKCNSKGHEEVQPIPPAGVVERGLVLGRRGWYSSSGQPQSKREKGWL